MSEDTAPAPDADILRMDQALERGDHRLAAELARALASSDDEAKREASAATLARLRHDPVIVGVLLASAAILAAITLHWFGHR
ncbi:MAG: hypothetical protein R3A48_28425 [Polyangiales bacterium]